ncbi:hypothetical protein BT96DRAFT_115363 [Gymnopus androsaceus JB14]|uniref:Uncharacterized protein n=1 Tax=Gymnopus androsaceus JB14 TaxID=1447944 RepID=A0A6A4HDC6_9AGAR|nr:hypothetical protein BT96DRAFT_115363 [Gymnopus androsaceus JB14]
MGQNVSYAPVERQPAERKRLFLLMNDWISQEIQYTPVRTDSVRLSELHSCHGSINTVLAGEYLVEARNGMRTALDLNPYNAVAWESLPILTETVDNINGLDLLILPGDQERDFDPANLVVCRRIAEDCWYARIWVAVAYGLFSMPQHLLRLLCDGLGTTLRYFSVLLLIFFNVFQALAIMAIMERLERVEMNLAKSDAEYCKLIH